MEQWLNDEEEEKIEYKTSNRARQNVTGISNPRTESRQNFLKIKEEDPRIKLQEASHKNRKDRKQSTFKENRIKKNNDKSDLEAQRDEKKEVKELTKLIKFVSELLDDFMKNTQRELEIIQRRVELSYEVTIKDRSTVQSIEESLTTKLKNLSKNYEEINNKINLMNMNVLTPHEISNLKSRNSIRNAFVHNRRKHRNGVAIIHKEDRYVKVPLISVKEFDKWKRRIVWKYKVWDKEKAVYFREFYEQNKEFFVHGRDNILHALRERTRIKIRNMNEYRERQKIRNKVENMEI